MALTDKLTNIANAIRQKGGTTEKLTLDAMPTAISALSTGGGGGVDIPDEAFVISGCCDYWDYYGKWDSFISAYANKWSTNNITDGKSMFHYSYIESIPFDINFDNTNYINSGYMFAGCGNLKEIGKIVNMYPAELTFFFNNCHNLRYLPQFENLNMERIHTYKYSSCVNMFENCYSLRHIPEELLKQLYQLNCVNIYSSFLYSTFASCYSLDEIKGINPQTGEMTNNLFSRTFSNCSRVKNIIFDKQEDGTPYVVKWKDQVIELHNNVGHSYYEHLITTKNSGITADKQVKDDATYQALKNNPDWFCLTENKQYSRYNHDSAVATINSLPDTSAYLASVGGTNTIKFNGTAGSATDGGAINTLTEQEIAVATAKGWTVSLI